MTPSKSRACEFLFAGALNRFGLWNKLISCSKGLKRLKSGQKSSCSFISFFIRDFSEFQKSGAKNYFFVRLISYKNDRRNFWKFHCSKIWVRFRIHFRLYSDVHSNIWNTKYLKFRNFLSEIILKCRTAFLNQFAMGDRSEEL